ncbi:MAG: helix-turn-helix transcriptional regulator [Lachnospiraceae bacterium]|jgi:putative transcriptional regulator|nr:helix-turn-helix transcriptional regulator [Lachnospiraceae bacterium]
MIKYDKLWDTMKEKGITKYTLYKEYHFSKSLIHRLQHNGGVNMHTINTLCNILECRIEDIATYFKDE